MGKKSKKNACEITYKPLVFTEFRLYPRPLYPNEFKKIHVPAFGSWDCNDDLPFTQSFESARQAGLLHSSYSEDRDLYVTGDLYQNDVVTLATIVVPRRRKRRYGLFSCCLRPSCDL
ncbi:hypothetical protein DCAR_0729130 [Daucus carota subsp. sativus]|uniref:RIN4 pathogenic type III effector avirulence factor Avr cleavage site domain-containing protein n=1 Tax=Daucus carota subsp. sativus TaxID=79200 RepID=A0AAF0XMB7_DAUCS|nr:hypothetical protein DCAR_0729130 [Daucus carota subsp. sativus]